MKRQRNEKGKEELALDQSLAHLQQPGDGTPYLSLEEYLGNIIQTNESGDQILGCVGHKSLMLWVDLLSNKIEWVPLFWDSFCDAIPMIPCEQDDESKVMWDSLKILKEGFESGNMSEKLQHETHKAFKAWENTLIDQHTLRIGLESQCNNIDIDRRLNPMEAMSMIEKVLNTEYDLLNPNRESAISALKQILEISFFADKEDRTTK